jgi:hypothetical protein
MSREQGIPWMPVGSEPKMDVPRSELRELVGHIRAAVTRLGDIALAWQLEEAATDLERYLLNGGE